MLSGGCIMANKNSAPPLTLANKYNSAIGLRSAIGLAILDGGIVILTSILLSVMIAGGLNAPAYQVEFAVVLEGLRSPAVADTLKEVTVKAPPLLPALPTPTLSHAGKGCP